MKTWITEIKAIDPLTGELKTWCGPNVEALTWGLAEEYLQLNGLGYCRIKGQLHGEIDMSTGKMVQYDEFKGIVWN